MQTLTTLLSAAGLAAMISLTAATPSSAAPLGSMQKSVTGNASQVETVDYRGGRRHCHWRDGRRWCHGGYSGRYYDGYRYGYRPGVYLRFGFGGDRGYRHHRRNYWR